MYRNMVSFMALVMILLGAVMVAITVANSGFGVGVILGLLFIAAGGGRLLMLRRRA